MEKFKIISQALRDKGTCERLFGPPLTWAELRQMTGQKILIVEGDYAHEETIVWSDGLDISDEKKRWYKRTDMEWFWDAYRMPE